MKKRTCFTCRHFLLCFLRRKIEDAVSGARMLNIDTNDAPKRYIDLFDTLGKMCLEYKFKQEDRQ